MSKLLLKILLLNHHFQTSETLVTVAIVDTPAANPSNPSIKLTVLVIPTTQKIVTGIAKYSKKNKITKRVSNKIYSNIKRY